MKNLFLATVFALLTIWVGFAAHGQVTYSVTTIANAFVATGPPGTNDANNNYGGSGALFVASASNAKGEFETLLTFDLSGATNDFNEAYGTNNWTVSAMSLTLTGNAETNGEQPMNSIFPKISAGNFAIEWLSDNDWTQGTGTPMIPTTNGITFNTLSNLLTGPTAIICTNTFTPPTSNNVPLTYPLPLDTNVVAGITNGGQITFLLYAANNQIACLFNARSFGASNEPLMNVTATALPPQIITGYFTNGWFQLNGTGIPDASYEIQATTNLPASQWQTLGTVMSDGTGLIEFADTNAAGQATQFYRLAQ